MCKPACRVVDERVDPPCVIVGEYLADTVVAARIVHVGVESSPVGPPLGWDRTRDVDRDPLRASLIEWLDDDARYDAVAFVDDARLDQLLEMNAHVDQGQREARRLGGIVNSPFAQSVDARTVAGRAGVDGGVKWAEIRDREATRGGSRSQQHRHCRGSESGAHLRTPLGTCHSNPYRCRCHPPAFARRASSTAAGAKRGRLP